MSDKKRTTITRSPAFAGVWYPSDPVELAEKIDGLLAAIKPERIRMPIQVLISPNAGYGYSGAIMAEAFRHLRGYSFRRVVVIGPSHEQGFNGLSLPDVDQFQTPLGDIELDKEVLLSLRKLPIFKNSGRYHEREYSIELLLPFLQQTISDNWKLVPILTGGLDHQDFADAAAAIQPLLDADDLLVISGDFTRYGPAHNYVPFPADDKVAERIQDLDKGFLDRILTWDPEGLAAYAIKTKITASVLAPAILMLNMLNSQCIPFHFRYKTSATTNKDSENSVSYCSGLFMGPMPLAQGDGSRKLSGRDFPTLKKMAIKCMKDVVRGKLEQISLSRTTDVDMIPLSLRQKRGAFIKITKYDKPRSFYGTVPPAKSLYETVLENIGKAVLHDPKAPPVTEDELPFLEMHISILSLLSPVESYKDIELGKHGIAIEKGHIHAAFLPNIAVDQGWGVEETLNNLSAMAGLPPDSWQQPDCHIMVFTTENYS
ncbi:MAG: AmmeMemoRadiSam system protein B [Magnetococcales bacterium]|nr:AmmeMemoRadiSam system protein B [Magnetococcales bacterium]